MHFSIAKRAFFSNNGMSKTALHIGLQDPVAHYGEFVGAEKVDIGVENTDWWDIKTEQSTTCLGPTPPPRPGEEELARKSALHFSTT